MDIRLIDLAHEDERRPADLAEALPQIRHEQLLLGVLPDRHLQLDRPPLHRPNMVAHGRIDLRGFTPRPAT